jgi:hypothetical protein
MAPAAVYCKALDTRVMFFPASDNKSWTSLPKLRGVAGPCFCGNLLLI